MIFHTSSTQREHAALHPRDFVAQAERRRRFAQKLAVRSTDAHSVGVWSGEGCLGASWCRGGVFDLAVEVI